MALIGRLGGQHPLFECHRVKAARLAPPSINAARIEPGRKLRMNAAMRVSQKSKAWVIRSHCRAWGNVAVLHQRRDHANYC